MKLRRLVQTILVAWAVWLAAPSAPRACAVCFGEANGPMIDGARMGVWLLFGLTGLVQLAFLAFFVCLYRRGKAAGSRDSVKATLRLVKGEE